MKTIASSAAIAILAMLCATTLAAAESDQCVYYVNVTDVNGTKQELVNLTSFGTVNRVIRQKGGTLAFNVSLSPCSSFEFNADCTGFAHILSGKASACFTSQPQRKVSSSNVTELLFSATHQTRSMLLTPMSIMFLDAQFVCDTSGNEEPYAQYSNALQRVTIHYPTQYACGQAVSPTTAPAPSPTSMSTTPAPLPSPKDEDKGLSPGAIVGIIAGCVVVVVAAGFAFFKCRKTETQAEGEYSRV